MTIEADLYSHIVTDSTIAAVIGTRFHPLILPQATLFPAVTYQRISTDRGHTMKGPDGLASLRMQIDCYSDKEPAEARLLAAAIRERLDGLKGPMGDGPTQVQGIFFEDEREMFEQDAAGATLKLYRVSSDYIIWAED